MTWDEWDYQLALCYRVWRAMPTPPSKKKEPVKHSIFTKMMQAHQQLAKDLHALQPITTRTKPWPTDPEDVLIAQNSSTVKDPE